MKEGIFWGGLHCLGLAISFPFSPSLIISNCCTSHGILMNEGKNSLHPVYYCQYHHTIFYLLTCFGPLLLLFYMGAHVVCQIAKPKIRPNVCAHCTHVKRNIPSNGLEKRRPNSSKLCRLFCQIYGKAHQGVILFQNQFIRIPIEIEWFLILFVNMI